MRLAFQSSTDKRPEPGRGRLRACATNAMIAVLMAAPAAAQLLDAPGREETERLCKRCHEVEKSVSLRQDRDGWARTMDKMMALGVKGTDEELGAIFEYLVKNYPADEVPKLNVNKAAAIELESGLTLRRSQAAAIIAYREKNGPFKTIEDLKKVPGIDASKIEAKKDRLAF
jgi:competence protein ComEA